MADIKLYGSVINGDGNFLIDPTWISSPDEKGAIQMGTKKDSSNIISYINKKITGKVGEVKTGLSSANSMTFSPSFGGSATDTLTIIARDNTSVTPSIKVSLPKLSTSDEFNNLSNNVSTNAANIIKLSTEVASNTKAINKINGDEKTNGSINWVLKEARDYADGQLTSVYKAKGSLTVEQLKALNPQTLGDVYNITEKFTIGGNVYPAFTNVLIKTNSSVAPKYDDKTGFNDDEIDALGGSFDQSALEKKTDERVKSISVDGKLVTVKPVFGGELVLPTISYTWGDGTTSKPLQLGSIFLPSLPNIVNNIGITNNNGVQISYTVNSSSRAPLTLPTVGPNNFGVVKVDSTLNVNNGVISAKQNSFDAGVGIDISSNDSTDSKIFTFSVNYAWDSTYGGPVSLDKNSSGSKELVAKFDYTELSYVTNSPLVQQIYNDMNTIHAGIDSTTKDLEKRVTALETLLSLG